MSNSSVGVSSLANEESGNDILTSNNGAAGLNDSTNVDDLSSNLFCGEDEWIDTYYDDIIYDDYAILESHFDHMEIPPGVEAPFPWLPSSPRNDTKVPTVSTSTYPSSQLQSDGVSNYPGLNSSHSSWLLKPTQMKDMSTSWSNSMTGSQMHVGNQHMKGKLPSKWMEPSLGQKTSSTSSSTANMSSQPSKGSLTHKSGNEPWRSSGKSKRKPRASHAIYASNHNQFPSAPMYPCTVNGSGSYSSLNMPSNALGVGNSMPVWQDLPLDMLEPSLGPAGFMNESPFSVWEQNSSNNVNGASSIGTSLPTRVEQRNVDEILHNFNHFKKFDTVEDYSDHYYSKNASAKQVSTTQNMFSNLVLLDPQLYFCS